MYPCRASPCPTRARAYLDSIEHLAPELSRIRPIFFYWMFIAADLVCIALQASGGALSTVSLGASQTGVKVALAGLGLQVAVLFTFFLCFADYMIRYFRSGGSGKRLITAGMRVFFGFLSLAVLCILGRCAYRCYELSQGYRGSDVITDEGLFIGLEGVYVLVHAELHQVSADFLADSLSLPCLRSPLRTQAESLAAWKTRLPRGAPVVAQRKCHGNRRGTSARIGPRLLASAPSRR